MQKRLMRSQTDKMLAGVCGGLAEYFLIDPVIVRLIFVLISITTGLGLLFYPILWLIMPKAPLANRLGSLPNTTESWQGYAQDAQEQGEATQYAAQRSSMYVGASQRPSAYSSAQGRQSSTGITSPLDDTGIGSIEEEYRMTAPPRSRMRRGAGWGGFVLIGFGLIMLSEYFQISTEFVVPLIFIIVGALLVFRRK